MPTAPLRPGPFRPGRRPSPLLPLVTAVAGLGLLATAGAAPAPDAVAAPEREAPLFDRSVEPVGAWARGFARDGGALVFRADADARLRATAGGDPSVGFGLPGTGVLDGAAPGAAAPFRQPHAALFAGGTSASVSSASDGASGRPRWRAAVATRTSLFDPRAPSGVGGFAEAAGRAGPLRFGAVAGLVREERAALGEARPGGAPVRGVAETRLAGGYAALPLGPRAALLTAAHASRTAAAGLHGADAGAAAVGLVLGAGPRRRDRVVLSASRPLAFSGGWAEADVGRRALGAPAPLLLDASWRMTPGEGHALVLRAGAAVPTGDGDGDGTSGHASLRYRIEF